MRCKHFFKFFAPALILKCGREPDGNATIGLTPTHSDGVRKQIAKGILSRSSSLTTVDDSRRDASGVVAESGIELHQCIRRIFLILKGKVFAIPPYFAASHLERFRIPHIAWMQDV